MTIVLSEKSRYHNSYHCRSCQKSFPKEQAIIDERGIIRHECGIQARTIPRSTHHHEIIYPKSIRELMEEKIEYGPRL